MAPRFVQVWGVSPAFGRGFADSEHYRAAPASVLISDRYWRRRFGADENVLGKTLRTDDGPLAIVGVMPASFLFPERDVNLWVPLALNNKVAQVGVIGIVLAVTMLAALIPAVRAALVEPIRALREE